MFTVKKAKDQEEGQKDREIIRNQIMRKSKLVKEVPLTKTEW